MQVELGILVGGLVMRFVVIVGFRDSSQEGGFRVQGGIFRCSFYFDFDFVIY